MAGKVVQNTGDTRLGDHEYLAGAYSIAVRVDSLPEVMAEWAAAGIEWDTWWHATTAATQAALSGR